MLFGGIGQRGFKVADVFDRVFDFLLQYVGQRPVGKSQLPSEKVDHLVHAQQEFIKRTAYQGQYPGVLDEAVELVSVYYQETLAGPGDMHVFVADLQVTQDGCVEIPQQFVMVAGHINYPGPVFCLAQDCPYHVVMGLRPVNLFLHLPDIDDIADQVKVIAGGGTEEIQQVFGAASGKPEMHIRNENAPVMNWAYLPQAGGSCRHFGKTLSSRSVTAYGKFGDYSVKNSGDFYFEVLTFLLYYLLIRFELW